MLAALSIDLDSLKHYHRIHGLPDPPPGPDPVYREAAERFGDLCARLQLSGTAFCIGEELLDPGAARSVRALADAGHEIGNHTLTHDYALTRRTSAAIAAEVRGGAEAIERAVGRRPAGFRAPGYTLSAALLATLAAQGYRYDASAFPAFPYHAVKGAVVAALALAGRPSRAILDRPRALLAPRRPYRPREDEPYARGGMPILELPVATGLLGFPIIGTFVATLPHRLVRVLAAPARRRPLLDLELHGVDLLDASEVAAALASRRRDLRVPAARKIARIEAFVRSVEAEWSTLERAASMLRL